MASPEVKVQETLVWQLVLRLKEYETDLCIRVNVPMKEFKEKGQKETEERRVKELLERIAGSLVVRDFGLFGQE